MSSNLAVAIVAAAALAGQTDSPPSHYAHLKEIAWWVGTWDVEGKMSDGREFKGQHTWEWTLDKNFLSGDITSLTDGESDVEARFIVGWEPMTKEIKGWEFWREGYRGTFVVTDEGMHLKGSGEDNDGPQTWTGKSIVADDHLSYTYKATVKRVDGTDAVFQFKAVKRNTRKQRVGDSNSLVNVPPKALKALKLLVGTWEGENVSNGKKIGGGVIERKWMPGNYCILMSGVGMEEGVKRHSVGLSGWDANGGQIVEHWHASDGLHAVIRYPLAGMKTNVWAGNFTVTFGDGNSYDGKCSLELGDNELKGTACWEQDGREMVRKSIARRIKKQ